MDEDLSDIDLEEKSEIDNDEIIEPDIIEDLDSEEEEDDKEVEEYEGDEEEEEEEESEENDEGIILVEEEDSNLDIIINNYNKKKRRAFNILTIFEKNYLLGLRTQQIINGSVVLIDINKINLKDRTPYNIAKEELKQKKIPFKIKKKFPDGSEEIWDINELKIF